jgi:dihydroceramidase
MSPHRGFWGSRTSAVDWCEANYTKTPYVAEFWNTLSSLALCVVAMIGLRFAHRYRYPLRIVIAYVGVFLIGTGSVAFHGTLTRTGQAIDELSMVCQLLFFVTKFL